MGIIGRRSSDSGGCRRWRGPGDRLGGRTPTGAGAGAAVGRHVGSVDVGSRERTLKRQSTRAAQRSARSTYSSKMAKIWTTPSCKALKISRVHSGERGLRRGSSVVPPVEFSQGTMCGRDFGQAVPEFRGEVGFGLTPDSLGGRVSKLRLGRIVEFDLFGAPSLSRLHVLHRHGEMLRPIRPWKLGRRKGGSRLGSMDGRLAFMLPWAGTRG